MMDTTAEKELAMDDIITGTETITRFKQISLGYILITRTWFVLL